MYDFQFSDAPLTAWVLFHQTCSAIRKAEERKLATLGLTPEKLDVLWACAVCHSPLTPAELSRMLFRESQSVAGLLARMERDGLVTRTPKRKGRPFTEVKITARGSELLQPGLEESGALIARAMGYLSAKELEQLQKLVRKLRQKALEELQMEPRSPPGYTSGEAVSMER